LGNRGNEVSIFAIILLSVALLFFPVQQGYGFFTLSPELNEPQLIELHKLEQVVKAEQARNENFVLQVIQNPYLDTSSKVIISFKENNEEQSPDRNDENFQLIKDEQISIAEKKYKEILGGKTILNSIDDELVIKKTIHKFKIDNQTGFMTKYSDDFENYRLLQISIAVEFRDNNWKGNSELSNPYQNKESIKALSNNVKSENFNIYRTDRENEEFENLKVQQLSLAENIRNEILNLRIDGNPYLDENLWKDNMVVVSPPAFVEFDIDMDMKEFDKPDCCEVDRKDNISTLWKFELPDEPEKEPTPEPEQTTSEPKELEIPAPFVDPTYVTDGFDFNVLDRNDKGFEVIKGIELEIAQNTLNEMLMLTNSDEDDVEIIISTNENNKLTDIKRGDQGFKFFKNKQIEIAEQKLMEILGQKNIHNSDY